MIDNKLVQPKEVVVYVENGGGMAGHGERRTTYFDLTNSRVYRVGEPLEASKLNKALLSALEYCGEGASFKLTAPRPTQEMLETATLTPRCACFDTYNRKMYYITENHTVMLYNEYDKQEPTDDCIKAFVRELIYISGQFLMGASGQIDN